MLKVRTLVFQETDVCYLIDDINRKIYSSYVQQTIF